MGLTLVPTYDEMTRREIENHLAVLRVKRLRASAVYYSGVNAKIYALTAKQLDRIMREYQGLRADLEKMDMLSERVEQRLVKLEAARQILLEAQSRLTQIEE